MNLYETLIHSKVGPQWSRIGIKHHHGINLPLSAIHTKQSCGIGEFYDLIPLIDWCSSIGMDVIQLLPLNDTGDETSPFFALSALALNPLFLSLHQLEGVDPQELEPIQRLNETERVAYPEVISYKSLFLRSYFQKRKETLLQNPEFREFIQENCWVENYGLFKVLKDLMSKNHWQTWPQEIRNLSPPQLHALVEKHREEIGYYTFLQYLCFKQLTHVKNYSVTKGVYLKGDIPILVSPDSADVWEFSEEFDLSLQAGAPPDPYNLKGQAWGLPIFKWDAMRKNRFDWWKRRLHYASQFYDIYRIDHVVGFFRIWAIPQGEASSNGTFIPKDEADWLHHGTEILSTLIDYTPMLPIAEDLGIVPLAVKIALSDLGICGTKVMHWEKVSTHPEQFIDPLHYSPISMTTVSTHDSETLSLWWRGSPLESKAYAKQQGWEYREELGIAQRKHILWDSHHSSSLFHINLIGEYLALFPELVSDNPQDERINVPGTISPRNWTYRIRPSVEQIVSHPQLREEMRWIIQ